jgi:TPR repeat protein
MPNDKHLPATVPTDSASLVAQSSGLVARGLLAVQRSIAVIENNDAEELFKKGMRYRNGEGGTPRSDDRARTYLRAAAKLNHAEAQYELSILLGDYGEWPEAVAWLESSVWHGFGRAQGYLAPNLSYPPIADHLTNKTYDVLELYCQAYAWYEQRANAGDAEAQYEFALMLNEPDKPAFCSSTKARREKPVLYSPTKARLWMRAAAEQDHDSACIRLGEWLLEEGEREGIYFLSRAADLGLEFACRRLGDLYLYGHLHRNGVWSKKTFPQVITPDKPAAISWYEREIELCKKRNSFWSTYDLAQKYLLGYRLDQDLERAEQMLLLAAEAGDISSQRALASEYISGRRLKRDAAVALHWLKAAEQNKNGAKEISQYQLGLFYESGTDDAPNYQEAINWHRKAADLGEYRSQKRLGEIYEFGQGVPKDYVQAYKWYLLSAANSYYIRPGESTPKSPFHASVISSRDLLVPKMTAGQLAESRQLARAWVECNKSMLRNYRTVREGLDRAS